MQLLLNCDLGEIEDPAQTVEHAVMPFLDMANIACGAHAGSPATMANTLKIAREHGVLVGAHPGYGNRENFGRISVPHSREELTALLHHQIAALDDLARQAGLAVDYVKPHGALYNDMMANGEIRETLFAALAAIDLDTRDLNNRDLNTNKKPCRLMMLATAAWEQHRCEGEKFGIDVIFETFADRCYSDDGFLLPRSRPGAVHNAARALEQVHQLCESGAVTTMSGNIIPLQAQTLCIHGDSPDSVAAIRAIHQIVHRYRR